MPKKIGNLTLYSVDDLNQQLGISKMTIRAYLRDGKIQGRKLGVSWYVTEDAIRAYFEGDDQSESPSTPEPQVTQNKPFRYVVEGINDLVSEKIETESVEEAIQAIESQKIISLFQVSIINTKNDEVLELVDARDFLERHQ
mgnify:FL=1